MHISHHCTARHMTERAGFIERQDRKPTPMDRFTEISRIIARRLQTGFGSLSLYRPKRKGKQGGRCLQCGVVALRAYSYKKRGGITPRDRHTHKLLPSSIQSRKVCLSRRRDERNKQMTPGRESCIHTGHKPRGESQVFSIDLQLFLGWERQGNTYAGRQRRRQGDRRQLEVSKRC